MKKPAEITRLALKSKKKPFDLADEILKAENLPEDVMTNTTVAKLELAMAIRHYRKNCSTCKGEKMCNNPYLIGLELFQRWIHTRYYPCKTNLKLTKK